MARGKGKQTRVAMLLDKSQQYMEDPNWDPEKDHESQVRHGLQYVTRGRDYKDLAKELFVWMENNGYNKKDIKGVKGVHPSFYMTVAELSFLANHRYVLSEKSITFMRNRIAKWIAEGSKEVKEQTKKTVETDRRDEIIKQMQGTVDSQNAIAICEIADMVEDAVLDRKESEFDFSAFKIIAGDAKKLVIAAAKEKIKAIKDDYEFAKTDKEAKDGLGLSTIRINRIIKFLDEAILVLEGTEVNKTVSRKPRVAKPKSAAAQVAKFKYQTKDTKLNVESADPMAIVGANKLVVFNTKTRKVGVYYAKTDKGFSIKGTTILNFDEDKSTQKTVRATKAVSIDQHIAEFRTGTKAKVDKVFAAHKTTETKLTGRTNGDTLLLKVFK